MRQHRKSRRNNDLAKIHIGAKELGMDPHDKDPGSAYRTMLWNVANVRSSAELSDTGRQAIIKHLKSRGWKPKSHHTSSNQVGLIRHIWNKLADADVVHHREGLSSWLQSNTKSDHPQRIGWQKPEFMPSRVRSKVIEQLKQWAKRSDVRWK